MLQKRMIVITLARSRPFLPVTTLKIQDDHRIRDMIALPAR